MKFTDESANSLTVTIGFIYGAIGLLGKDYDMPVAVLSALSLGLAVDFAIHFLEHTRVMRERYGSWEKTAGPVFGEPARAISRNVIVISVGFLPLLPTPLLPYRTVGIFMAAILGTAGVATLLILPALVTKLEKRLFRSRHACCPSCDCLLCMAASISAVLVVVLNVHQFLQTGWDKLTTLSAIAVPLLLVGCWLASRRNTCKTTQPVAAQEQTTNNEDRVPSKGGSKQ
jgi:predicted exporter